MTLSAVLSNFLWIPKALVKGSPHQFAPEWEHSVDLLKTPEGKIAQQQISFLREQAILDGEDPDDIVKDLTSADKMEIANWVDVGNYWALCRGDVKKMDKLITRLGIEVEDKRVRREFDFKTLGLHMVSPPRPHQIDPIEKWAAANHGILKAAPAFGKSYVMIDSIIRRCQWTIVLVHTDVLAEQFITRFRLGTQREDGTYSPLTNCLEIEEREGVKLIGRYRTPDQLFPVTVATWQSFANENGKKALKKISKSFGRLLTDEVHVFAAKVPAAVVNAFHAEVRQGVSATPTRKDQLDIALPDILGPVTAVGDAKQLPFTSYLIQTGCKYPAKRYPSKAEWALLLNWLCKQEDRNELIKEWLKYDVSQGRSILVFADRVQWCMTMAEEMTRLRIPSRAVVGGMSSKKGLAERDYAMKQMMNDDIHIIFATSVFKAGVDIPRLDTVYYANPQNNPEQLQQGLGRMRRDFENKQDPVFRYFVDSGHGLLLGCARGTQRTLVAEKSEIIFVPEGKKPGAVHAARLFREDGEAIEVALPKKKGKLRSIADAEKSALSKVFSDLREDERQAEKYQKRLGKNRN